MLLIHDGTASAAARTPQRATRRLLAGILFAALVGSLPAASAAPAQQAYIKASNTRSNAQFSWSLAVSGDTIIVGAHSESSAAIGVNGSQSDSSAPDAGAAYIFVRDGTNWFQQAYLKASNTESRDAFGYSVAISGDTVVIGALGESSNAIGVNGDQNNNSAENSGAAYVFVRNGSNWTQQAYLKASNTRPKAQFGWSVAVSGDTIVVGANGEDSSTTGVNGDQSDTNAVGAGAAYVFTRNGSNWAQQAYLKASNSGSADGFGYSVAICGDTAVVGALGEDSNAAGVNGTQSNNSAPNAGAGYIFGRDGTNWMQRAYLKGSNTRAGNQFGRAVAIGADTVVIGAIGESSSTAGVNGNQSDTSSPSAGAAYIFVHDGSNWIQQAYLKASNTRPGDYFGGSVAISGDTVAVGAPSEDSNATGINGDQSSTTGTNSGAVYIFVRSGTNWNQQNYLKASNTGHADWFGEVVALSGETVAVGAPYEDSSATGVNGTGSDPHLFFDSGAAYVFTGLGIGPRLVIAPDGDGGQFIRFEGAPYVSYRVQRADGLNGQWATLSTFTAPASGMIEFHDTNAPPAQAFYRTVQP